MHLIEAALRTLGHGGSSWVVAILIALSAGPLRYMELLEQINKLEARWQGRPLSEKVLSQTLRKMGRDRMVARHRTGEFPPSTWYELTPRGRSALAALRPLAQWAYSIEADVADVQPGDVVP